MAFNRENLTAVANTLKSGVVPVLYVYFNEANDTVTTSGFFTDNRLVVGDQIDVVASDYTARVKYRVSAVSEGAATIVLLSTDALVGGVQTLTGAGAVDVTNAVTLVVTTGANALTLADGVDGQVKKIVMKTDGGDGTLTPAHFGSGSTITFNDAGDSVTLLFVNAKWYVTSNVGATVA